jgi:hypothetical protein
MGSLGMMFSGQRCKVSLLNASVADAAAALEQEHGRVERRQQCLQQCASKGIPYESQSKTQTQMLDREAARGAYCNWTVTREARIALATLLLFQRVLGWQGTDWVRPRHWHVACDFRFSSLAR